MQRVHRVEPQRIDVEVREPHQRIVENEPAHLGRVLAVEVDLVAPRGAAGREVGTEPGQIIAARTEVVVNDVEDDGQPVVTPTLHARSGDLVYCHGSTASRTLRRLAAGVPVCLTVSLLALQLNISVHTTTAAAPTLACYSGGASEHLSDASETIYQVGGVG